MADPKFAIIRSLISDKVYLQIACTNYQQIVDALIKEKIR